MGILYGAIAFALVGIGVCAVVTIRHTRKCPEHKKTFIR